MSTGVITVYIPYLQQVTVHRDYIKGKYHEKGNIMKKLSTLLTTSTITLALFLAMPSAVAAPPDTKVFKGFDGVEYNYDHATWVIPFCAAFAREFPLLGKNAFGQCVKALRTV